MGVLYAPPIDNKVNELQCEQKWNADCYWKMAVTLEFVEIILFIVFNLINYH